MIQKDALILIDAIKKSKYNPNDWELNFLQSIETLDELTYKQSKCLENIYAKAFGGGRYVENA